MFLIKNLIVSIIWIGCLLNSVILISRMRMGISQNLGKVKPTIRESLRSATSENLESFPKIHTYTFAEEYSRYI